LQPGDVVGFQLPNWHEAIVINLAACIGGFVCNPIVSIYRDAEVSFILKDSSAKVLFIPERFRSIDYIEMVERLRPGLPDLDLVVLVRSECDRYENIEGLIARQELRDFGPPSPNDVKLLLYTSGTTGNPKGVLHTHNTLWSEIEAVKKFWEVTKDDHIFMPSPVTHITGYLYALELPFATGARSIFMAKWNADEAVQIIRDSGSTITVGATPFLVELAKAAREVREPLETLRLFACGGAPVASELILEAAETFANCRVARVYGCSEAPTITAGLLLDDDPVLGATTDGRILNSDVRIVDADGRSVAPGEEGEVCVRGPEVMIGYTDPAATAAAFDEEGFFHTGDLGFISYGCFITISGRKKDLIIRGGENISPKEIEDCLLQHPEILDAAVVAAPHQRLGETPMAYLIARDQSRLSVEDIQRHLESCGLARQKFPEYIEYLDDLPRTASGKVQKHILRKREQDSTEQDGRVHG
jgi:acyl-CoA synthetase (AMP-forming)/AMP-acid ligase II